MDNNQFNNYDNNSGNNNRGPGNGGNNNNNGNNGKDPKKQSLLIMLVAALISLLCISYFMRTLTDVTNHEITYNQFLQMIDEGKVESVKIESSQIIITPKSVDIISSNPFANYQSQITYKTGKVEDDDTLTKRLLDAGIQVQGTLPDSSGVILNILSFILPVLLMWGLLSMLMRKMTGGGAFSMGKSNAKVYVQKETGITFKDVAGEDEAKESLQEVVDFLHNPGKYAKIGAKLPKGALLVGPPGTGKTLLAKAVAGEAKVPFFSLAGSDFIELYVGVGASRVRDLFKEAEKNAPCIIFIDEIDAIGRSRDSKYGGGNEEREQTLNQLLSEMDGFDAKKGIIILAATNRPEILDKALLRPGRFDRRVIVDKPDLKGRVNILKVHSKDVLMDETVDLDAIALATSGAVGADLANMINEAAINAVKEGREFVSQKDLFNAVEVVLVGKEKKDRIMSKEERKIVSYHEVGHALVSALQKNSEPVQKITIVPRTMGALGYVMHVPEDEKYLDSKAELHDRIVGLLGGRAAEEIVFDTVTSGAANDIEKATNIARQMITRMGMSEKFGLIALETVESQYLDGRSSLNCAERTAAEIDQEVMKMLKEAYEEALTLLRDNRELMDKLAEHLIEKETITGKEFMKIYRAEKGLPEPEEEKKEVSENKTEQNKESSDNSENMVSEEKAVDSEVQNRITEEKATDNSIQDNSDSNSVNLEKEAQSNAESDNNSQNNLNNFVQQQWNIPQQMDVDMASKQWNNPQQSNVNPNEYQQETGINSQQPQNENPDKSQFGSAWDRNING
ncbi:MAG: ATP-dependent zinc metalloprotease FtsH [Lachnospiraceae bacterium]|nr:ATP-dependent zinc metalloprotease FtsH [Lachnospiraceae bacterium]MEE0919771.1 ATP-dependent zinc metalloprotease FtsH [Lachnospiraceae bacterium]